MQVNIEAPKSTDLVEQASATLAVAKTFIITTHDQCQLAATELGAIKSRAKELNEKRLSITRKFDDAKKEVMDLFKPALGILEEAETVIKKGIVDWQQQQERLRKAEEMRLAEVARKERDRLEAEVRKVEEAARKKADELAAKAAAELAAGNAAKAAELQARAASTVEKADDRAGAARTQASMTIAPTVIRESPKVQGVTMRTRWKSRVVDAQAVPREYMVVNEKALDDIATATKGALKIPGVEFYGVSEVSSARTR